MNNEELVEWMTKMIAEEHPNQIKYTLSPSELVHKILFNEKFPLAWIEEDQLCSVCASEKTHRNGCPYRRWMRVTQLNKMEGEDEIS